MKIILPLEEISKKDLQFVGGKAYSLAQMQNSGFRVPHSLCLTTKAYNEFVDSTGLRERILLELNRKEISDMRWEEVWDCALRIRNMFLNTPIPRKLNQYLHDQISSHFSKKAVVVRSSSPAEDSAKTSFAGLHESFLNIIGIKSIIKHIKLVWASLWSDASIYYRQELGLNSETSSMAVVIQQIVFGNCSGVVFSQNPTDASQMVIEAVHGLNQGLVDGIIEPDRWLIDRSSSKINSFTQAKRTQYMIPAQTGIQLVDLPTKLASKSALDKEKVMLVCDLARKAEQFFGAAQDVEWTFQKSKLITLQSRPITTVKSKVEPEDDRRQWDLSLRRSYDNLKLLRKNIEKRYIPEMIAEAERLAAIDLSGFSNKQLAKEIEYRTGIFNKWKDIYWAEFIPFAHGIRLFGQVYNDAVHPTDPYQFVQLLQATEMKSLERNRKLADMAMILRENPQLLKKLRNGDLQLSGTKFTQQLDSFIKQFGDLSLTTMRGKEVTGQKDLLVKVLVEMASIVPDNKPKDKMDTERLKNDFLKCFEEGKDRDEAQDLLELARVSYQLRDDDNIYLGRIEDQLKHAANEGRRRLENQAFDDIVSYTIQDVQKALLDSNYKPVKTIKKVNKKLAKAFVVKSRQIVGQPAGPGLVKASARVVRNSEDLGKFKNGEILVCDAVDPTMTFIVPLAAGIVERRGGMLIHGAIIAREYGIPCITGVPNAIDRIKTGDRLVVDGYLGIVTLSSV